MGYSACPWHDNGSVRGTVQGSFWVWYRPMRDDVTRNDPCSAVHNFPSNAYNRRPIYFLHNIRHTTYGEWGEHVLCYCIQCQATLDRVVTAPDCTCNTATELKRGIVEQNLHGRFDVTNHRELPFLSDTCSGKTKRISNGLCWSLRGESTGVWIPVTKGH